MKLWTVLALGLFIALVAVLLGGGAAPARPASAAAPQATFTPAYWLYLPDLLGAMQIGMPSPTPPHGNLTMTGLVYDAIGGRSAPIPGATVGFTSCLPRSFSTLTAADGTYSLLIPADYLWNCDTVSIGASAAGYLPNGERVSPSWLYSNPVQDFALSPLATASVTPSPPAR